MLFIQMNCENKQSSTSKALMRGRKKDPVYQTNISFQSEPGSFPFFLFTALQHDQIDKGCHKKPGVIFFVNLQGHIHTVCPQKRIFY